MKNLKGTVVLTFEETTVAQWMYTELKDAVTRIIVCDPHRNRLLSEGPKTDPIDAGKLVQLLRANLLKEVYHASEKFSHLRKLTSGYNDLVQASVCLQNQQYSLLRGSGLTGSEKVKNLRLKDKYEQHVLDSIATQLECNEHQRKAYLSEFKALSRQYTAIRHQMSIPGIGLIGAVQIVTRVVSPHRFVEGGQYLSYCGLIKHDRVSGNKSYGKKDPRFCRKLKSVYKTAAMAAIGGHNPINDYYEYLVKQKGDTEAHARHKTSRKIALLSLGVFKSGKKYQPFNEAYRRRDVTCQN
ncbi:MAG: transposase [Deltaproteobacteria bacterium]|nr:transposase [Deltaproteobacteria bacterium]